MAVTPCPDCGLPAQICGDSLLCCNCGSSSIAQRARAVVAKIKERLTERTALGTYHVERWCLWVLMPFIILDLIFMAIIFPTHPDMHNNIVGVSFLLLVGLTWLGYFRVEMIWRVRYPKIH